MIINIYLSLCQSDTTNEVFAFFSEKNAVEFASQNSNVRKLASHYLPLESVQEWLRTENVTVPNLNYTNNIDLSDTTDIEFTIIESE